jgi:hypothetical protein
VNIFYGDCGHIWVVLDVAPDKYASLREIFQFSDPGKLFGEGKLRRDDLLVRKTVLLIFSTASRRKNEGASQKSRYL